MWACDFHICVALLGAQRQQFSNHVLGGDLEVMHSVFSQERFTSDLQFPVQSMLYIEMTEILTRPLLES